MADNRKLERLRGTAQAIQKTKNRAARAEHIATDVKEKLDRATKVDGEDVSQAAAEPLSELTNAGKATARGGVTMASRSAEVLRQRRMRNATSSQRTAQAARRASNISGHIRKRAATAARSASKAAAAESRALLALLSGGGFLSVMVVVIVVVFGCGIALFGGNDSVGYTPVSAEVEAYDSVIRHYASQHGIGEYVDLIKAVMMQESGGQGSDPMQASECGYNTRFPRKPNGITDPEYSVNVGVKELAACLRLAKAESPVDMEHIRLALQGYNYGEGYISWAKSRYGGYTVVNAAEYSTMMAERNHWKSYGDNNYVNHVLQYYPLGHAFLAGGGQALVEVARSQLGNVGGEPYWSWYGFPERVEWCACFVSWCADQCGYIEGGAILKYSYCPTGAEWFKEHNQWGDRDITPEPGMIVFFDWVRDGSQDGEVDHTGIVEKIENGRVYTIEGNSGNTCREKSYPVGWSEIYGYGILTIT